MKKFTIYMLALIWVAGACRDDEKSPLPDFTHASIPVFTPGEEDTGFIDFNDFDATTVSFNVDKLGRADVEHIDVWITYQNSETGENQTINYATVTTLPQLVEFSIDELLALFPEEVVTRDSLSLGDSFVVGGNVMLADGRYLTGGYSTSVSANDPVQLTYNVACASALQGTYDLTLVSGNSGEVGALPGQTIARISPGYYEISDITMDIFGGLPVRYRFTDICGRLIPDAASVEFGTQIVVAFSEGTAVDPVTGEITFAIEYIAPSCCGLEGIKTVFKATPR